MRSIRSRAGRTAVMLYCIIWFGFMVWSMPMQAEAVENQDEKEAEADWPEAPSIGGVSGIVMEASTGAILYEKDMHAVCYPASITKIMTVLLAIENCEPDEIVTIPPEAVYMEDKGTHIALDVGEQLTVEQCLYAVMLASANDAAYALAEHTGGTIENFITMMNEKAKELGCENTHFTNPHGLPDENHVTSAYDMALITRAALEYDIFRTVSGTSYYEIQPSAGQKDLICMYNHHKMIGKGEFYREEVFAGKNGYTNVAQNTLVTCARKGEMELICVVMKEQRAEVYPDTIALLEYGMDHFKKTETGRDKDDYLALLKEENPGLEHCFLIPLKERIFVVMPENVELSDLEMELAYEKEKGLVTVTYYYDDFMAGTGEFKVIDREVETEGSRSRFKEIWAEKDQEEDSVSWNYPVMGICVGAAAIGIGVGVWFLLKRRERGMQINRTIRYRRMKRHRRNRHRRGGRRLF